MGMMALAVGLLAGAVPVIGIVLAPPRLRLWAWVLLAMAATGLGLWVWLSLARCRDDSCLALEPWLLGLTGGLVVATLIGGIRWLASRGKRPW